MRLDPRNEETSEFFIIESFGRNYNRKIKLTEKSSSEYFLNIILCSFIRMDKDAMPKLFTREDSHGAFTTLIDQHAGVSNYNYQLAISLVSKFISNVIGLSPFSPKSLE